MNHAIPFGHMIRSKWSWMVWSTRQKLTGILVIIIHPKIDIIKASMAYKLNGMLTQALPFLQAAIYSSFLAR